MHKVYVNNNYRESKWVMVEMEFGLQSKKLQILMTDELGLILDKKHNTKCWFNSSKEHDPHMSQGWGNLFWSRFLYRYITTEQSNKNVS